MTILGFKMRDSLIIKARRWVSKDNALVPISRMPVSVF